MTRNEFIAQIVIGLSKQGAPPDYCLNEAKKHADYLESQGVAPWLKIQHTGSE